VWHACVFDRETMVAIDMLLFGAHPRAVRGVGVPLLGACHAGPSRWLSTLSSSGSRLASSGRASATPRRTAGPAGLITQNA
jgi:hypothetical protein